VATSGFYSELGRLVRVRRKELRLSQEVLAERLGLARTSVANLEMGSQRISAEVLVKIAAALAVDISQLLPLPDRDREVGELINAKAPPKMRPVLRSVLLGNGGT
jgi:transcriptional regulator with XRE-family HTH domain